MSDPYDDRGFRLYLLLGLFDTRDGSYIADLIQAAREGFERSHPEMGESGAWDDFDRLWDSRDSEGRIREVVDAWQ